MINYCNTNHSGKCCSGIGWSTEVFHRSGQLCAFGSFGEYPDWQPPFGYRPSFFAVFSSKGFAVGGLSIRRHSNGQLCLHTMFIQPRPQRKKKASYLFKVSTTVSYFSSQQTVAPFLRHNFVTFSVWSFHAFFKKSHLFTAHIVV